MKIICCSVKSTHFLYLKALSPKKEYEFGDISKEVESRRVEWVKGVLGEDAAVNYEFGDITKKAMSSFTGKDEYEFGDVSKKIFGNMFGKRKRGGQ